LEFLAKDSKGDAFPRLCLSDSIRHDDPCVQQLLKRIEEAPTLAQLILAVWPLARVLALHGVEYVLAERAQRPRAWLPCPICGVPLRSKGLRQRFVLYPHIASPTIARRQHLLGVFTKP